MLTVDYAHLANGYGPGNHDVVRLREFCILSQIGWPAVRHESGSCHLAARHRHTFAMVAPSWQWQTN